MIRAGILISLIFGLLFFPASFTVSADINCKFKGSGRFLGMYADNPDEGNFYPNATDTLCASVLRLIGEVDFSPSLYFEVNTVHDWNRLTFQPVNQAFQTGGQISNDYRHPDGEWTWQDADHDGYTVQGVSAIDRCFFTVKLNKMDMTLGRQPINLGNCFFFTPNDFFQPYSAQAFNRVYKPGVDALRLQYYTGQLSQISLIGVCGYKDHDPDWTSSALLIRGNQVFGIFEISGMAGKLDSRNILGIGIQGEIGNWGIRSEMNQSFPDENHPDYLQAAFGADRRWSNSFHLIIEYLYHGNGVREKTNYLEHMLSPGFNEDPYLGIHYLGIAANYEFHPLVNGDAAIISNLTDPSCFLTGSLVISLSNESECVLGIQYPIGKDPTSRQVTPELTYPEFQSEYGFYPLSLFAEFRIYF
ncbi:hypothetical protein JW979_06115 [bacterium]|nr:hypothetical protein [candidate division CSSED10-310 bacterium]